MIQPPSVGPMMGATTTACANVAMAMPRFCGGKLSSIIACAIGTMAPPPAPCKIRAIISIGRFTAMPHKADESVNIAMQEMKTRFRPK